jgi:hypothetical protein
VVSRQDDNEIEVIQPFSQRNSERPLSDSEIRELRVLMEADRRLKWLWKSIRVTAIWVTAVAGAVSIGWDMLIKLALHLTGK